MLRNVKNLRGYAVRATDGSSVKWTISIVMTKTGASAISSLTRVAEGRMVCARAPSQSASGPACDTE